MQNNQTSITEKRVNELIHAALKRFGRSFTGSSGAAALDDLTDVNISSPSDEDVLTYDSGSGEWIAAPATGTSPADGTTIEDTGTVIRIKDGGVTVAKLGNDAVETAKIKDANVTTAKILDANVTTAKIANDAVDKDKLGILTTKGDLIAYSTEPLRVAVGSDGKVLTADSGAASGLSWQSPLSITADWNPALNQAWSQHQPGTTSVVTGGWGGPTATGAASVLQDSTGAYANYASSATSSSEAGWIAGSFVSMQTQNNPVFYCTAKLGATAAAAYNVARTWIGVFSATPMASDTPSLHYAGFRYAPATDGTAFWRCVSDNASGTPQSTTTTVAIAADTRYVFKIVMAAATILFYINGTLVATHSSVVPTSTTTMGICCRVRTLENVAKNLRVGRVYFEQP